MQARLLPRVASGTFDRPYLIDVLMASVAQATRLIASARAMRVPSMLRMASVAQAPRLIASARAMRVSAYVHALCVFRSSMCIARLIDHAYVHAMPLRVSLEPSSSCTRVAYSSCSILRALRIPLGRPLHAVGMACLTCTHIIACLTYTHIIA